MESVEETNGQALSDDSGVDVEETRSYEDMVALYDESMRNLTEGEIVRGHVINITSNDVIVDVGYKSEGLIPIHEFTDHQGNLGVEVGDDVDVLLEKTEDQEGHVLLSKQKAERMMIWADVENSYKEGRTIVGRVIDRIKGGLTVDVGIRAFLPGSLVDIRPIKHLESLRGQEFEFKVISLDRRRNNVVLSRKAVLEKEFAAKKKETLGLLKEGVKLDGVVKNITDYGVFVDLGGIDGLLHITDISWGRVNHPSEHFGVGDEVQVVVLKFDPETERVSLGYKQRSEDPWSLVDKKYPLGSRLKGKVVSEMSWTKKVVNPSKVLEVGQEVEAIVSELDLGQRRISLSLRQADRNPWEDLAISHPVGSLVEGNVRNLTEFGAFVEITEEIDGLIHVSDMSWTKRIKHPSEVVNKGEPIRARITGIDVDNQRVSLSIKEFLPNEWQNFVDDHRVGDTVTGRVVNVTDFGLFVDVYQGLEGLAHISEIDVPSGKLEDHYSVGGWISARILRIEDEDKKVGLTMRGVPQPDEDEVAELEGAYQATIAAELAVVEEATVEAAEVVEEAAEEVVAEVGEASDEAVEAAPVEDETAVEVEAEVVEEAAAVEAEAEAVEEAAAVEAEAEVVEEAAPAEAEVAEEAAPAEPEAVVEEAEASAEEVSDETPEEDAATEAQPEAAEADDAAAEEKS